VTRVQIVLLVYQHMTLHGIPAHEGLAASFTCILSGIVVHDPDVAVQELDLQEFLTTLRTFNFVWLRRWQRNMLTVNDDLRTAFTNLAVINQ